MNKDKIIKDLKKQNDSLKMQYEYRNMRCVHLEIENQRLKELCDKYEKEHNTVFQEWKSLTKEYKTYLENKGGNNEK